MNTAQMHSPNYSMVIATFRRPTALAASLAAVFEQTKPPSLVVVADNDPQRSAEAVVSQARPGSGTRVEYLPMEANLGPAGGWARAAAWAQAQADRGEWLLVGDDDDPLDHPAIMNDMVKLATEQPSDVAAIGMMGATLHRGTALLRRVRPDNGGVLDCDYLGSGGMPLYRWSLIDELGFFDEDLFFGFEDLDYGLRLRTSGRRLVAVAPLEGHMVQPTSSTRVAWREYFKTRALIIICRRHLGWWALTVTTTRAVLLGAPLLTLRERRLDLFAARWRGLLDGLRERSAQARYIPQTNPAKQS